MIQYETLSRVTMTNNQRMRRLLDLCNAIDEQGRYQTYFEKSRLNQIDIAIFKNDDMPLLKCRRHFPIESAEAYEGCCKSLIELLEECK